MLAVQPLRLERAGVGRHELLPGDVPGVVPGGCASQPSKDHQPLKGGHQVGGGVCLLLKLHDLPPTGVPVRREQEPRPRVLQTGGRGGGGEAGEDGDGDDAQLPAGEEDTDDLGDHGHVDAHGVPYLEALSTHGVGKLVGLNEVLAVGRGADRPVVPLPDAHGAVGIGLHPAVQAVAGDVDLAPGEPTGPGLALGDVQHRLRRLVPDDAQVLQGRWPEPLAVLRAPSEERVVVADAVLLHEPGDVGSPEKVLRRMPDEFGHGTPSIGTLAVGKPLRGWGAPRWTCSWRGASAHGV